MTTIATALATPEKAPARRRKSAAGKAQMQPRELLDLILASLDDGQAQDIVTIDLAGKASFCDYMVVASGRSQRHVAALATNLEEKLKPVSPRRPSIEGLPQGDWVLVDAGDVVVHLFRPEVRAFYGIEKMWADEAPAPAPA